MSEQRLRLDGILRRVLQETVGEIHLYYQPPANVTVITKTPDSDLTAAVSRLDQCRHDRSYIADNLYHDVFTMTV